MKREEDFPGYPVAAKAACSGGSSGDLRARRRYAYKPGATHEKNKTDRQSAFCETARLDEAPGSEKGEVGLGLW